MARWSKRVKGNGLRVLVYHRFPQSCRDALAQQCAFLREHATPISLCDAIRCLEGTEPMPPNAVSVTIDDGYLDYMQVGHEVFSAYGIPTAIFVTSKFIDGGYRLWFDRLEHAVLYCRRHEIQIGAGPWGGPIRFCTDLSENRSQVVKQMLEYEKRLPGRALEPFVACVEESVDQEPTVGPPKDYAAMTWKDLRTLATTGGLTVGAHTTNHPILSRVESARELDDELAGCRQLMEQKLGLPVEFVAYPNGQPQDVNRGVLGAAREAGYRAGFTTVPGLNRPGCDFFALKRLSMRPEYPVSHLADALATAR